MKKKENLPYNLLFEVLRLGMTLQTNSYLYNFKDCEKIAQESVNEMDRLSKMFGYSGYKEFDRKEIKEC